MLAFSGENFPPGVLVQLPTARVYSSLDEILDTGGAPGWVLFSESAPAELLIAAVTRLGQEEGGWAPLLVRDGPEGPSFTPLILGYSERLDDATPRLRGEEDNSGLLSFRALLQDLSRIRHDINNPLTAAFAEVQLLLMDLEPGSETAEALAIVEGQLFRIRDLVAELTAFRAPSR